MGQQTGYFGRRLAAGLLALGLFWVSVATAGDLRDRVLEANGHWASAVDAYRAGEMAQSVGYFEQALELRPGHPTLIYNLASVRAKLGDNEGALAALGDYAALGVFNDLAADDDFGAMRGNPEFEALVQQITAHSEPVEVSSVAFATTRPMGLIEGIAYDKPRDRFFLTSLSDGVIYEVSASDGEPHSYLTMADHGLWGLMGIEIDTARDLMWVTSAAMIQTAGLDKATLGASGIFAVDLKTGNIMRRFEGQTDGQESVFGDLAIGPDGSVYVTDSTEPRLLVLPNGEVAKAEATAATDFYSAQGIVIAPRGGRLIVADYGMGLLSVEPESGDVGRLEAPDGVNMMGIDGLSRHGETLIAIQNGANPPRMLRILMDRDWQKITAVEVLESAHPAYDEPTRGVVVGDDFYYIANSGWPLYGRGIPDADALASQKPLTVLKLPLN